MSSEPKKQRVRNFRKKPAEEEAGPGQQPPQEAQGDQEEGDAPEVQREKLEQMRLLQRLRKRAGGTSASELAQAQTDSLAIDEPDTGPAAQTQLMEGFSKATAVQKAEEDPNMAKFIEAELAKRLGKRVGDDDQEDPETKRKRLEVEMYKIPEEFKSNLVGDTVIPGMTTIITEVSVSVRDRLRNIEEVESMKKRMLGSVDAGPRKTGDDVQRNQFVASFGKQQKKELSREEREEQQRRMKYITEKRPAVPVHRQ